MSVDNLDMIAKDNRANTTTLLQAIIFMTNVTSVQERYFHSKLSVFEDYLVGVYLLLTGICSIFLNSLVIYVCFKKRHLLVSSDYYIVNLAISDLLLPVIGFPFAISSSFDHKWIYGYQGCQAYGFVGFFCGIVSITTLALMSFVRYISVCRTTLKMTIARYTNVLITGTYFYACLWAFPPIIGWGAYGVEPHGTSCTLQWHGNRSFVTLMLITCIVLPVFVMNVSYGLVWNYLKKNTKSLKKWSAGRANWKKREYYLIKITFTMCCAFMGTWTPYAVVSLWSAYGSDKIVPVRVTLAAVLMAKLATVINPLIYFMLNKKFSPYVKEYLRTTWRTIQFSSTTEERDRQYQTSASPDVL